MGYVGGIYHKDAVSFVCHICEKPEEKNSGWEENRESDHQKLEGLFFREGWKHIKDTVYCPDCAKERGLSD